jgi:CRP/FNR family transcriptional regulator, cyclic AMP receptor protein
VVHCELSEARIFAGLSAPALKLLGARALPLVVQPLEIVVHEGEPGDRLFVIQSGEVRACRSFAKVNEVELARLGQGECFGEMCILDTLPRSATVQATRESRLCSLNSVALYELHVHHPSQFSVVLLNLARELSRRLRSLDKAFAAWQ